MIEIGTLLDNKYRILAEVGHGGQSCVYLALNEKANKQWAVKEILKGGDIKSLITETEILKKLDNPHLPSIVDIITEKDRFIIIMDYVEGITLRKKLREEGRQSQDNVVDWMIQICDVFSYLHRQKPPIIYRDLKPANIMLKPDGTAVLIDFGAAREYKQMNTEDTSWLGTPGYAAPEQYGGDQTDERTDIYTIGTTMYHLLTGKAPYLATSKSILDIDPEFSTGLDYIINKCTQLDKKDRFQSCSELKWALQHYRDFDKESIKKRKKGICLMAMTFVAALLCLIGYFFTASYQKKLTNENYEYYIRMAKSSVSAEQTIDYLKDAIGLEPDESEAYLQLLSLYLDDNEFSQNEAEEIIEILGYAPSNSNTTYESSLKTNDEGYAQFAFQLGLAYYYYYDNGRAMSEPWFDIARTSTSLSENQIRRAQILYEIAGYYSELNSLNLAGDASISYGTYWDDLISFLEYDLVAEDNVKTALVTYKEIIGQIISNAYEFQKAGISQSEMEDAVFSVEEHISSDIEADTLDTADEETLSELEENIQNAKLIIVTTFQEID